MHTHTHEHTHTHARALRTCTFLTTVRVGFDKVARHHFLAGGSLLLGDSLKNTDTDFVHAHVCP